MSFDISQGGISFVSPEVYRINDEGIVEIPQLNFKRTAKIVSVGYLPDFPKFQKFGAEFTTPLMAVELGQLLKMADSIEKSERKI